MELIKYLPREEAFSLMQCIHAGEHEVTSKTIAQNEYLSITLFAFDQGEEISTHASSGDAMVQVLEGTANITINGHTTILQAGQTILMPAGLPHALAAKEAFKMLLTVVFSIEDEEGGK